MTYSKTAYWNSLDSGDREHWMQEAREYHRYEESTQIQPERARYPQIRKTAVEMAFDNSPQERQAAIAEANRREEAWRTRPVTCGECSTSTTADKAVVISGYAICFHCGKDDEHFIGRLCREGLEKLHAAN